jgi:putative SOS response-associated peptidase YedK
MCGRVRLITDFSEIRIRLKFDLESPAPNYAPDWNIPPTGKVLLAVRSIDGKRIAKIARFGLIPRWAKDEKIPYSTHNARVEEFRTKPAFKDAWKRGQRCLCVTNGFYEWQQLGIKGNKKQAYAIGMADDGPMVMAGLWEVWKSPANGEEILTCTVLTCEPNKSVGEIHDRMPVILDERHWPKWLGEEPASEDELVALLKPCPDGAIKIWPVDNKVGNVRNTGPQLIKPLEPEPRPLL